MKALCKSSKSLRSPARDSPLERWMGDRGPRGAQACAERCIDALFWPAEWLAARWFRWKCDRAWDRLMLENLTLFHHYDLPRHLIQHWIEHAAVIFCRGEKGLPDDLETEKTFQAVRNELARLIDIERGRRAWVRGIQERNAR